MEPPNEAGTPLQRIGRTALPIWAVPLVVVVVIAISAGIWLLGPGSYLLQRAIYTPNAEAFSGSSDSLRQTVIVPTLDTPCPANKNVIWCSAFQLAWDELRDNIIGAPLQIVGAEEIAARLNAAKQSGADLLPSSYYAAAGWIHQGIIERIEKEMAARFPSHSLPDFKGLKTDILAYAYLAAHVPFRYPFIRIREPLIFTDSQGRRTRMDAFGLSGTRSAQSRNMRGQVALLYSRREPNRWAMTECAIDLCKYSQPYQVVVAVVEPKGSLAQTLEYMHLQISQSGTPQYGEGLGFGEMDVLAIPEMVWHIDHRFRELIGKEFTAAGPVVEAMETIRFRLDRCGTAFETEGRFGAVKALPREFLFNRPFLVYLQKRGAQQPFFVMWVDNAELLTRR